MKATIWVSSRECRCIIRDDEGRVIDLCNEWNNVASTQAWLYDAYPEAEQIVISDTAKFRDLDLEWVRCKHGNG